MMKNWFKFMAAAMAMSSANETPRQRGRTHRRHGGMIRNPAGSKALRRAYKAANGMPEGQRGSYEDAAAWYRRLTDGKYKAGHQRSITGQPVKFT